ncbi:MAG: hypothetical protein FJX74_02960 [Armatimonadetes bacterium]|nr:hypothetical protein [Armatimonadota bacterium]
MSARTLLWLAMAALALGGPARAELPQGLTYDDAYAWFAVETITDVQDGKPYAKGWILTSQLRILGRTPDHSAFRLLVKQGGQTLATVYQDGSIYRYNPPAWAGKSDCLWNNNIVDRKQIVKAEGPVQVEVYYVQGDDLSEHLARVHTVDVRKVTRVRGSQNEPDSPQYYVNRNGEAAVAWIYQRAELIQPYTAGDGGDTYSENVVELVFGVCPTEEGRSVPLGYVRTTVDGKPLDLSPYQQYTQKDAVHGEVSSWRQYEVVQSTGPNEKEPIGFRQYSLILPFTFGPQGDILRDTTKPSLSDHPGQWECTYIVNGQKVRTWRFTVGQDGNIQPHPEEQHGLGLAPGAHLVEMAIPDGGAFIDERLVPEQAKTGGFYGRAWQSEEMKAAAAGIPAKGTPWP